MSMVLVTGATGNLGSKVVQKLLDLGHTVRAYARGSSAGIPAGVEIFEGDIRVGSGLVAATKGVAAIVHCATFFDPGGASDFEGTRHLLRAAAQNGSPHVVYISIVGVDRIAFPYFRTKREVERLIEASGLPYSILRSTQFHDLVLKLIISFEDEQAATITLPEGVGFQSIDVNEAADALVRLTTQGSAGRAPDIGGPQALSLEAMAETYAEVSRKQRTIRAKPMPDAAEFHDAFRDSVNVVPGAPFGEMTWDAFLRQRQ
jgi:uncharacterized protein YbjT (DUF2867 family)